jgi:hypothetical protein
LNPEPVGNNELAKAAGVAGSTASAFFKRRFGGIAGYRAACRDPGRLVAALKLLNNEYTPQLLTCRLPRGEDNRGDEADE